MRVHACVRARTRTACGCDAALRLRQDEQRNLRSARAVSTGLGKAVTGTVKELQSKLRIGQVRVCARVCVRVCAVACVCACVCVCGRVRACVPS